MAATPEADPDGSDVDPGISVVLNALHDALGGEPNALGDERSLALAKEVFGSVIDDPRREAFRGELAAATEPGGIANSDVLTGVASDVADALAERGVRLRLDHVTRLPIDARSASLYTFITTHDGSVLEPLDLPEPAGDGTEALRDGAFDRAAAAFEASVDAAGTGTNAIATRTLAGYAYHRAGEDGRAMDFVEEALHLETDAIAPKCVGLAADHRFPAKFRNGKLGVRLFLRRTQEIPDGGSIGAAIDNGDDRSAGWEALDGPETCQIIDRVTADTRIRLRVEGSPTAFPALVGYYVGLGVVDLEVDEVRGVEKLLLSGPEPESGPAPTETLWLVGGNDGT